MDNRRVEATKLALLGLFENQPGKAVMAFELKLHLPENLTDEEFEAAMNQLEADHFVSYRDGHPLNRGATCTQ